MIESKYAEILSRVEKPARYTGGEFGAPTLKEEKCNYCVCFPDVYEVGMSNVGIRIVMDSINQTEGAAADRCFAPWIDYGTALKEAGLPLRSLGLKKPLGDFDMLGFSLQYELSYTNVLYMLDLAKIPLRREERGDNYPIIQAGGPCVCNPEPLADFIDIFTIGDGEEVMPELAKLYIECGKNKGEYLRRASKLKGVYVPALTYPVYENGKIVGFEGEKVEKSIVDLNKYPFPTTAMVANTEAVFDRAVVEVMRGCFRGCRFCQAGFIYRPVRRRELNSLLSASEKLVNYCGYEELSLNSLSTGDYGKLKELIGGLKERLPDVSIALPSLRVDSFEGEFSSSSRKSSLTFAPEAGTKRLRDVINKDLTEEEVFAACEKAFRNGYSAVKLYFMLGLPTETLEDLDGIEHIVREIKSIYGKTKTVPKALRVSVGVSTFIPKPFTPFEWAQFVSSEEEEERRTYLLNHLRMKGVSVSWSDYYTSYLESVFARGDRNTGKLLLAAYRGGAIFDGWNNVFKRDVWLKATEECGLNLDAYVSARSEDEIFPWDFINMFVDKRFLLSEKHKSERDECSGGCMKECKGCGISKVYKCRNYDNLEIQ